MTSLKITSKGQVTLRKAVLAHLGAGPGDDVSVTLLPGGRVEVLAAAKPAKGGGLEAFKGSLARPGQPTLTIDEINEAAATGWAGQHDPDA